MCTTQNFVFSVTYCLELRNAISSYCTLVFLGATNGQYSCLDILKTQHLYLVKKYMNSKKNCKSK